MKELDYELKYWQFIGLLAAAILFLARGLFLLNLYTLTLWV